jgi:hypothetical protein
MPGKTRVSGMVVRGIAKAALLPIPLTFIPLTNLPENE